MTLLQVTKLERKEQNNYPDVTGEFIGVLKYNRRDGHLVVLTRICGTEMEDGETCERHPDECTYHD